MSDDFGNTQTTSGQISIGLPISGVIEDAADTDWFSIDVPGDVIDLSAYTIRVTGAGAASLTAPELGLFLENDAGELFEASRTSFSGQMYNYQSSTGTASFTYSNTIDSRLHIEVGSIAGTGGYELRIDPLEDDFPENSSTPGLITGSGSIAGEITGNETDWIAWRPEPNTSYTVTIRGDGDAQTPALTFPFGTLLNSDGTRAKSFPASFNSNGVTTTTFTTPATAQTYYISVIPSVSALGTYSVETEEIVDDFVAGVATTGRLTVGGSATGNIEVRSDNDWFAIDLVAGQTYRFDVEGRDTGKGTLDNPGTVGIYDGPVVIVGNLRAVNEGVGFNEVLFFTPDTTGTYYLSADGSPNFGFSGIGTYTVSASLVEDAFGETADTAGQATVGVPLESAIDIYSDGDWVAVEVEAGKTYLIDYEGASTDKGTLVDPNISDVYNSALQSLNLTNLNAGTGLNARVVLTATQTETLYVDLSHGFLDFGTYTFTVTELDDDFTDNVNTSGLLTLGGEVTGGIDYTIETAGRNDIDWHAITLEAGTLVRFRAEDPSDADAPLAVLALYDENGDRTHSARQDAPSFFIEDSGTYYAAVSSVGRDWTGSYELTAQQSYTPTPAHQAQLAREDTPYQTSHDEPEIGSRGKDMLLATRSDTYLRGLNENDILVGNDRDNVLVGDDILPLRYDAHMAAMTYRAFHLLLDRSPDQTGLAEFASGRHDFFSLVRAILDGAEFAKLHDPMTNEDFVRMLFEGMRGPGGTVSDTELQAYTEPMARIGPVAQKWAAVMVFNSVEFSTKLGGADMSFAFDTSPNDASDEVFALYQALLGRTPDMVGYQDWIVSMAHGLDLPNVAQRFMDSTEFSALGPLSDRAFVEHMLGNLNGALPSVSEVDDAVALLNSGLARADLVAAYVTLHDDDDIAGWMRGRGVNDVLVGGSGDNILIGGLLADTFVFNPTDEGRQVIKDFEDWDLIDLRSFGYADLAEALSHFQQSGEDVLFHDTDLSDALTLLIEDATLESLSGDHILV